MIIPGKELLAGRKPRAKGGLRRPNHMISTFRTDGCPDSFSSVGTSIVFILVCSPNHEISLNCPYPSEKCIDNDAKVNKDTKGWMKNCAYAVAEIGCVNRSVVPQINQTYADYFEGACCNSCKQKFERDNIPPKVPSLNFTYHQSDESYNLTKLNNTGWFAKKEKKIKAKEAEEAQRKSKEPSAPAH